MVRRADGTVSAVPRGFLLLVPEHCRKCEKSGSVTVETTLKGGVVALTWCCKSCNADWPVTPADHIERRGGGADRREGSRTNRRQS
jgi:hypothetical protein